MPLTSEQWDRVKDIVFDALQLPSAERRSFVQARCANDPALLAESLSLIARSSDILESSPKLIKGRYRLLSELARGGFALTYLAADQDLHDRPVVVKMLIASKAADAYVYRKFEEEIRALSLLEHPNIITPLDCGKTDDNQPFLVIQYAEGVTLRAWMEGSPGDRDTLPSIIRQLGAALAFAHGRGIVHRDVKPENVMMQIFPDGSVHVRLIDFGISSMVSAPDGAATSIAGTPSYMAPEQCRGEVSAKTDVFALGVLAYEVLTGRPPFGGGDLLQVMERQRRSVPKIDLTVHPKVSSLISRALAYRPADRPADILSFAEELADALQVPMQVKRDAKPLWIGAVVTLLVVAVALAYVFPGRPQQPAPYVPQAQPAATAPPTLALVDIKGESGVDPVPDGQGIVSIPQRERFRLHVRALAENHLYVFSRSARNAELNVLFPSPTANSGQSELKKASDLLIPAEPGWLTFGHTRGTDTLIFITLREADPVLEEAQRYANAKDMGAVPEGPITKHVADLTTSGHHPFAWKDGVLQLAGFQSAWSWVTVRHQ